MRFCDLYSYANNNPSVFTHDKFEVVKQNLESNSVSLIQWFSDNKMQANPNKFQAITVGRKTKDTNSVFQIDTFTIPSDEEVIRCSN